MLGEISALDGAGHSATVTAIEECEMLWLTRATFNRYLQTIPSLCFNLAQMMAQRLRHTVTRARMMARMEVAQRVACVLLDFARHFEAPFIEKAPASPIVIPLRLTQGDLGATVSATRASINRVLGEFREQGCIKIDDNQVITILNRDSLEEICS